MSADNMIVIRKVIGQDKYGVSMEFASVDWPSTIAPGDSERGVAFFDDRNAARDFAFEWERDEMYVEYGVIDCTVGDCDG